MTIRRHEIIKPNKTSNLEKTASVVIEVEKETASERERDKRAKRERERMAIVNEGKKNDQLCGG